MVSTFDRMTRVLLFGGHGRVALLTHPLLVADGHHVTAVIRNPDHADEVAATGATPVVADVERLDRAGIAGLIHGHDAVVWSAGAGGGNPQRTYAVDRDAAIRSMGASRDAGCDRYVMVSYFGAGADHGVPADNPFHHYAEAKAAADDHLRDTDLDWVVLGPSTLIDEPPTGLVTDGSGSPGSVPRGDVAAVIAGTLARPALTRVTYRFNGGEIPVGAALDALSGPA